MKYFFIWFNDIFYGEDKHNEHGIPCLWYTIFLAKIKRFRNNLLPNWKAIQLEILTITILMFIVDLRVDTLYVYGMYLLHTALTKYMYQNLLKKTPL